MDLKIKDDRYLHYTKFLALKFLNLPRQGLREEAPTGHVKKDGLIEPSVPHFFLHLSNVLQIFLDMLSKTFKRVALVTTAILNSLRIRFF